LFISPIKLQVATENNYLSGLVNNLQLIPLLL